MPYILIGAGAVLVTVVVVIILKNRGRKEGLKWKNVDGDGKVIGEGKECKKCPYKGLKGKYPCKHPSMKLTCCTSKGKCDTVADAKDALAHGGCATGECPDPKLKKKRPCLDKASKKCCDTNLKKCIWMSDSKYSNPQKERPTLGERDVNGKKCQFSGTVNGRCPASHPFKVDAKGVWLGGFDCAKTKKCAQGYVGSESRPMPEAANTPSCRSACEESGKRLVKHDDGKCWNHYMNVNGTGEVIDACPLCICDI